MSVDIQPTTPTLKYYVIDLDWEGAHGVFDYDQTGAEEQFVKIFKGVGIRDAVIPQLMEIITVYEIKKGTVVRTCGEL